MRKLLMLVVFFFVFFSVAQQLRPLIGNTSMIGSTSYYHYRSAEMIAAGQDYDQLSFGGRDYTYPPGFHYLLAALLPLWPFVLPAIGVLGVVLCYLLAKTLGFKEDEALFSAAVLGFIPGYAYLAGHLNPRLPALILLVFAFLLLLKKQDALKQVLAGLSLAAVFVIHPLVGAMGLAFGIVLFRKKLYALKIPYAVSLIIFSIWFVPFIAQYGFPQALKFYSQYIELQAGPQFFIFESALNSDSIGVITLLVAIYCLFFIRERKLRFAKEWLIISVLAALLLGNRLNEQSLFPIALLVGKVVISHWKNLVRLVRAGFINPNIWKALFLIYTALAGVLAIGSLLFFPPSAAEYSAMVWIKQNTPLGSTVMATWSEGHWISAIAMRKNVIDAYAEYAPNVDERYMDTKRVYQGSDITVALQVLKKYNVSYVYYKLDKNDLGLCTGFGYLTSYGNFDLVFNSGDVYVFRVDYSGTSQPADLCKKGIMIRVDDIWAITNNSLQEWGYTFPNLERTLAVLQKHNFPVFLSVTPFILDPATNKTLDIAMDTQLLEMIREAGYPITLHGATHNCSASDRCEFDGLNASEDVMLLNRSKSALEEAIGKGVIYFTPPKERIDSSLSSALAIVGLRTLDAARYDPIAQWEWPNKTTVWRGFSDFNKNYASGIPYLIVLHYNSLSTTELSELDAFLSYYENN